MKIKRKAIKYIGVLYSFSRGAVTRYHKLGGLNNRNLLSQSSGSWKSKTKVSAGLVSSEGCKERICSQPLSLAYRGTPVLLYEGPL